MKDITRIHIAKTPYNIELPAKKELQAYIEALESYTSDTELLEDIEIRITELLLENDIKPEGVISLADITLVRTKLGEPEDFMADGAVVDLKDEKQLAVANRTIHRNLETAIAGGVLGGIASYFRIDALWLRLGFIVLLLITSGLAALLYIVAWIIIPPARTATEILQMNGQPVTLASIREINEAGIAANSSRRQAKITRILTILLGTGAVLTAIGSILLMAVVAMQVIFNQDLGSQNYQLPLVSLFVSGALLVALSVLVAFASFYQKFNTRIWVSAVIIIALGLTAFAVGVVGGYTMDRTQHEAMQREMITSKDKLPDDFKNVTKLTVDIPYGTSLNYVTSSSSTPTIKQRIHKSSPKAVVKVNGTTATVSLPKGDHKLKGPDASYTIHGPAINNIIVKNGLVSYEGAAQQSLTTDLTNSSSLTLSQSRIENLTANVHGDAQFDSTDASVANVNVNLEESASANLGNIKTLDVKAPTSCGRSASTKVEVETILDGTLQYNENKIVAKTLEYPCFNFTVTDDELDD